MSRKARKNLHIVLLLAVTLLLSACILLPDFVGQSKAGKYDPADSAQRPSALAAVPTAETQTEPHTCGLHAMRSMYVAYGLSPEQYALRFRLGTDQPAVNADDQSTGTLHPDLYRVLAQDGFAIAALDLEDAGAAGDLQAHLRGQQLALAVVYRGTYHWVLLGLSDQAGQLVVYDSLEATPMTEPIDSFLDDALSITLVWPLGSAAPRSASSVHAAGLAEMVRLYKRKK